MSREVTLATEFHRENLITMIENESHDGVRLPMMDIPGG